MRLKRYYTAPMITSHGAARIVSPNSPLRAHPPDGPHRLGGRRPSPGHRRLRRWVSLLGLVAVGVPACGGDAPPPPDAFAGVPLERPIRLPEMVFPDMHGQPVEVAGLAAGAVTLVFVGYTYCPDVCPVHLSNLAAVLDDLPLEVSREVTTIFVTADPVRDTPERLRQWLGSMDGDFVGLRGSREEVNALEDALGLARSVVDPGDDDRDYVVAHAGQVLVFDGDGRARMAYPWGIRQRDWRRDLPRLVSGQWPAPAPEA